MGNFQYYTRLSLKGHKNNRHHIWNWHQADFGSQYIYINKFKYDRQWSYSGCTYSTNRLFIGGMLQDYEELHDAIHLGSTSIILINIWEKWLKVAKSSEK